MTDRDVCIVTGGRDFFDESGLFFRLDMIHPPPVLLVQGGARGADRLALAWAKSRGVDYDTVEADWSEYGRAAGPIRNREMLKKYQDRAFVVYFPGGAGTKNCVKTAEKLGIPVYFWTELG